MDLRSKESHSSCYYLGHPQFTSYQRKLRRNFSAAPLHIELGGQKNKQRIKLHIEGRNRLSHHEFVRTLCFFVPSVLPSVFFIHFACRLLISLLSHHCLLTVSDYSVYFCSLPFFQFCFHSAVLSFIVLFLHRLLSLSLTLFFFCF